MFNAPFATWLVAAIMLACGCNDNSYPRTSADVKNYIASKAVEVKFRLEEKRHNHPECDALVDDMEKAARNIRCGNCNSPVYPDGLPFMISNEVICPVCGTRNFRYDPYSGVTRLHGNDIFLLVGCAEEYEAREKYFKCIGWWK